MDVWRVSPDRLDLYISLHYPSQAACARELGVSRSRLNNWMTGVAQPRISELARLAALVGARVEDFLQRQEP